MRLLMVVALVVAGVGSAMARPSLAIPQLESGFEGRDTSHLSTQVAKSLTQTLRKWATGPNRRYALPISEPGTVAALRQRTQCTGPACSTAIAKLLGVDALVLGYLEQKKVNTKTVWRVNLRLVRANTPDRIVTFQTETVYVMTGEPNGRSLYERLTDDTTTPNVDAPSPAKQQVVAILGVEAVSETGRVDAATTELAERVASQLGTCVQAQPKLYQLAPPSDLDLAQHRTAANCATESPYCMRSVASKAGAHVIVWGRVERVDGGHKIRLRMVTPLDSYVKTIEEVVEPDFTHRDAWLARWVADAYQRLPNVARPAYTPPTVPPGSIVRSRYQRPPTPSPFIQPTPLPPPGAPPPKSRKVIWIEPWTDGKAESKRLVTQARAALAAALRQNGVMFSAARPCPGQAIDCHAKIGATARAELVIVIEVRGGAAHARAIDVKNARLVATKGPATTSAKLVDIALQAARMRVDPFDLMRLGI